MRTQAQRFTDYITELYEDGFDSDQVIDFLEDGEALAVCGFDDAFQNLIEALHEELQKETNR